MSDKEMNLAIAKALGVAVCPSCLNEIDPDTCYCGDTIKKHACCEHNPVPVGCVCGYGDPKMSRETMSDYCTDLNAMHEAEKTLKEPQRTIYLNELIEVCSFNDWQMSLSSDDEWNQTHAPARQRAEAFLRTVGKFDESVPEKHVLMTKTQSIELSHKVQASIDQLRQLQHDLKLVAFSTEPESLKHEPEVIHHTCGETRVTPTKTLAGSKAARMQGTALEPMQMPATERNVSDFDSGPGITPNSNLPRLVDGPYRKMLIEIEVAMGFEKRLDNQWEVEREIHADRWAWSWGTIEAIGVIEKERDELKSKSIKEREVAVSNYQAEYERAESFAREIHKLKSKCSEMRDLMVEAMSCLAGEKPFWFNSAINVERYEHALSGDHCKGYKSPAEVREMLPYLHHLDSCHMPAAPCTCGLEALVKEATK
jgi:hypothetical protein